MPIKRGDLVTTRAIPGAVMRVVRAYLFGELLLEGTGHGVVTPGPLRLPSAAARPYPDEDPGEMF